MDLFTNILLVVGVKTLLIGKALKMWPIPPCPTPKLNANLAVATFSSAVGSLQIFSLTTNVAASSTPFKALSVAKRPTLLKIPLPL